MPLMNGAQMIEVLQSNPQLKNIPVIVISGDFDEQTKKTYNKLGINSILAKPIEKEILVEEIKRYN
jgi:CheY-like chemotaxis protein